MAKKEEKFKKAYEVTSKENPSHTVSEIEEFIKSQEEPSVRQQTIRNIIKSIHSDINVAIEMGKFYVIYQGKDAEACEYVKEHFKDEGFDVEEKESSSVNPYTWEKSIDIIISW